MLVNENIIKEELQNVGILVDNIYDLVNSSKSYSEAIPVLVKLLSQGDISDDRLKEGIIRALAVKEAKGLANETLLKEFYKVPTNKMVLGWVIGNTMAEIMMEGDLDEVIKIIRNKENGMARQMFVIGLGRIKNEKTENVLIELLNDDEIAAQALEALGKLKSHRAKSRIELLLNHPKSLIRKEAEKALKKIG